MVVDEMITAEHADHSKQVKTFRRFVFIWFARILPKRPQTDEKVLTF